MQKTIEKKVVIVGTGIHSGRPVRVNINPAPTNHGIVFKRLDVDQNNPLIEANFKNILSGELCTSLVNKNGISVKTVEHLLAAFSGLGISNALVEIDNEEIPILDGSSLKFVEALIKAGICEQDESLNFCSVKKSIKVVSKKVGLSLNLLIISYLQFVLIIQILVSVSKLVFNHIKRYFSKRTL